jgi:N-acetyl-gamma-glutamylphosphate reductase
MARSKATVTLDRDRVEQARELVGAASMSEVIDLALERLIRAEQLRRDVAAYAARPLTDDELRIADLPVDFDLDDDADYERLYGSER